MFAVAAQPYSPTPHQKGIYFLWKQRCVLVFAFWKSDNKKIRNYRFIPYNICSQFGAFVGTVEYWAVDKAISALCCPRSLSVTTISSVAFWNLGLPIRECQQVLVIVSIAGLCNSLDNGKQMKKTGLARGKQRGGRLSFNRIRSSGDKSENCCVLIHVPPTGQSVTASFAVTIAPVRRLQNLGQCVSLFVGRRTVESRT